MKWAREIVDLVRSALQNFSEDRCMQMAAALAFYMMLSLAPLLFVVISIASFAIGPEAESVFARQVSNFMGNQGADELQEMLQRGQEAAPHKVQGNEKEASSDTNTIPGPRLPSITRKPMAMLMNWISILVLIFSATGVFAQLQASLNQVWDVEPDKKHSSTVQFLKKRLISFAMIIAVAVLLLASMLLTTILSVTSDWVSQNVGLGRPVTFIANELTSFVVITVLFASIFKVLPDASVPWKVTWIGAMMTALLFTMGKFVIGVYLGSKEMSTTYGQAGSLVLLLLWIYYSSIIFFLGAELTQAWARQHGHAIEPSEGAVRVVLRREQVGPSSRAT